MNWVGMKMDQGLAKSPSIPLYKRGKILMWFQQIPPFHKGGLGPARHREPARSGEAGGGIRQQPEGYTLVEILIAIAILAFGLMAVATMQVTAIKTNATASGISQGMTLAQAKLEELMNLPYIDLDDIDDDGTDPDEGYGLNDTVDPADECNNDPVSDGFWPNDWDCTASYRLFWNIAVDEPVTNSKTIRVIVIWTERGRDKRIALDFVKTDFS
jgi:prepilin-type N-terminal cleavage/methylation domain-containing protein